MLRLPILDQGLSGGCNFAAAAAICNLISGISEVLYRPAGNPDSGPRFKSLLENYFPWEKGERRKDRAKLLYKYIRNPLAHELGLDRRTHTTRIIIRKGPLSDEKIKELESSVNRPEWLPSPLKRNGKRWNLSVPAFYWAAFNLLRNVARDPVHMERAQERLSRRRVY
ncbi:MAG: hypothetical protein HY717_04260 [Planctomycetes bacterium]|nr:hypothetical protein [Planctomycetota bacterium]